MRRGRDSRCAPGGFFITQRAAWGACGALKRRIGCVTLQAFHPDLPTLYRRAPYSQLRGERFSTALAARGICDLGPRPTERS